MKQLFAGVLVVSSMSIFAAELKINVSAQGKDTCIESVKLFADLVIGKNDPSVKISAKKPVSGACDGETCNPDKQNFKIAFDDHGTLRKLDLTVSGPDTANRCDITRH